MLHCYVERHRKRRTTSLQCYKIKFVMLHAKSLIRNVKTVLLQCYVKKEVSGFFGCGRVATNLGTHIVTKFPKGIYICFFM